MKGDYGVRALVELAHRYGDGQVQSAAIATAQSIPEPYLDQLLTSLRRAGFIRSVRGPQGGGGHRGHREQGCNARNGNDSQQHLSILGGCPML